MSFAGAILLAAIPDQAACVKLNGPVPIGGNVSAFAMSPDGNWVVYLADQEIVGRFELYRVAITGGATLKLNGVLASGGKVQEFRISPDSGSVVYQADQDTATVSELYRVAMAGGGTTKLNGVLVPGGDVQQAFRSARTASRVVYRADQDIDDVKELYSVPLTGGTPIKLNTALQPSRAMSNQSSGSVQTASAWCTTPTRTPRACSIFQRAPAPAAARRSSSMGSLVNNGDVEDDFRISADSARVVYRADRFANNVIELFSVPLTGGASVPLNTPLPPGGTVQSQFRISSDGAPGRVPRRSGRHGRLRAVQGADRGGAVITCSIRRWCRAVSCSPDSCSARQAHGSSIGPTRSRPV